jgi:uncharacterized protein (DUF924 family)
VLSKADEVLDFWFGRASEPGYGEFRDEWFRKDPEFDARVTDQFPRNMFRGDGRTHAADAAALESSRYAVEHALDRELPAFQRMFLYMPFMHSENREDQRRSVELFGRFPHRNGILCRETTSEEAEFLKTEGSSF